MGEMSMEVGPDLTDEQLVLRGKEADRLLGDPLLNDTFDALEQAYENAWKLEENPAARGTLWVKVRVLNDLKTELKTYAERGKFAQAANK